MALTGIVIGGATGTGTVGVPEVLDLPQAEAESKLREFGLVPRIQTIEAEGVEGTVFSQNPAARTIRARRTVVTLLVIRAPVVPPNLGQQLSDLQTSVDDLTTKVDEVVPAVQAVGTQVENVGTKVDGVGTKVDGVGAGVDAVSAKVDDLGTAVAGVSTTVDGVATDVDALSSAVAAVETDASADTRHKAIIDRLDKPPKATASAREKPTGTSRSGA
jgi:outer membrane murein-binding lipoprotein Lpp